MIKIIDDILFLVGSLIIIIWGVLHIISLKNVIKNLGNISSDNTKIVIMGWISEGLTLCFTGILVFLVTAIAGTEQEWVRVVYWVVTGILLASAILTLFYGFRTKIIILKFSPFLKLVVVILLLIGILI